MSEIGETFNAFRKYQKSKKADNLQKSTAILIERGIKFESKNDGLHLIISTDFGKVNFYPSTGLYNGVYSGRGVFNLLKEIEK